MLFIHGRTAPPTSTFHIYLPVPYEGIPQTSGERGTRFPPPARFRRQRRPSKVITLRTHRQGR